MANLLLLDDSEVAGLAMRGITGRSRNRCVVAATVEDAWRLLHELVVIDLVVVELRLQGADGSTLIQRIREDPLLKSIPVVVYTSVADHALAVRLQPLKLQNYLIKPYTDEGVLAEIARARATPWRDLHFEEDRSFCTQMGLTPQVLRDRREALLTALNHALPQVREHAASGDRTGLLLALVPWVDAAPAAGFWGLAEALTDLQDRLPGAAPAVLAQALETLEFLARLLHARLHPNHVPEALVSEAERKEQEEAVDRVRWLEADVDTRGPVVPPDAVRQQVDQLTTCPVVDTIGAEFRMAAEAKSPTLRHLMDLVTRDPGLSAAVLVAANSLERDDASPVEDPSVAVTLLGDLRLGALARSLPLIEERHMHLPPITWSQFWLFQMGVAAVALHTAKQLEFEILQNYVHPAGLLHDIGRLLLLKAYPHGFRAIVGYAREKNLPLHEAELKYLGCTSRDMAVWFCEKHPVPPHCANVIRWVENPSAAADDVELVAVVSLARTLCLHHHVGYCGETPKDSCPPVEETPAWEVLRTRVYPSFNLSRFDRGVQSYCQQLKQELLGRVG